MVIVVLALSLVSAQPRCDAPADALVAEAAVRAMELDLPGAAERLDMAAARGCGDARVAALYLRGLVDAREAFALGGPPDALAPVHEAATQLEAIAGERIGPAAVAQLVLRAAAAAAQSEREEMALFLDEAQRVDSLLRAANLPGAPLVPAAEAAGDLWLRVHRYEDARRAYSAAMEQAGVTPRILAGLARIADRLDDAGAACAAYRLLLDQWGSRAAEPPDIAAAREVVARPVCNPGPVP